MNPVDRIVFPWLERMGKKMMKNEKMMNKESMLYDTVEDVAVRVNTFYGDRSAEKHIEVSGIISNSLVKMFDDIEKALDTTVYDDNVSELGWVLVADRDVWGEFQFRIFIDGMDSDVWRIIKQHACYLDRFYITDEDLHSDYFDVHMYRRSIKPCPQGEHLYWLKDVDQLFSDLRKMFPGLIKARGRLWAKYDEDEKKIESCSDKIDFPEDADPREILTTLAGQVCRKHLKSYHIRITSWDDQHDLQVDGILHKSERVSAWVRFEDAMLTELRSYLTSAVVVELAYNDETRQIDLCVRCKK